MNVKFSFFLVIFYFIIFSLPSNSISASEDASPKEESEEEIESSNEMAIEEIKDLPNRIEDLEKYFQKFKYITAVVSRNRDNKIIVKKNENTPLNPASAIKILTASAALHRLGTDFRFKTKIYCNKNGFYIQGGADPSFVSEHLYLMAKNFAVTLKKNLPDQCKFAKKHLILDSSLFDEESLPIDRKDIKTNRAYNSRISAINLNYNALTVKIDIHRNSSIEYFSPYIQLSEKQSNSIKSTVKIGKTETEKNIKISVTIPKKMKSNIVKYFNIENPDLYFGHSFNQELSHQLNGKYYFTQIERGSLTSDAVQIYEHESMPLNQIIYLMNKYSNNMIADTLTKFLATTIENMAPPFKQSQGLEVLKDEFFRLTEEKISYLYSGSGLTEKNKLSALEISNLLTGIQKQKAYFPEFLTSLPISGVDGTLRKLAKKGLINKGLRAKTGSLDDSQALVGYAENSTHGLITFAVIVNGRQRFDPAKLSELLLGESK